MQWAMKSDNTTLRDGRRDVLIAGIGVLPADLLVIRNYHSPTSKVLTMPCWLITWSKRTWHLLSYFRSIMLRSNCCLTTFKMSFNFIGFGCPFGKSSGNEQFTCRQYSVAFVWIAKSRFDQSRSLLFICSLNNVERHFSSTFRDDCYGCSANCSKRIIWTDNATTIYDSMVFHESQRVWEQNVIEDIFLLAAMIWKIFSFSSYNGYLHLFNSHLRDLFDFEIKNR
jgi:hypothetical protein